MKLIGSLQEKDVRSRLKSSRDYLFQSIAGKRVISIASGLFEKINTAYIINWIPEQGEEHVTIVVNGERVVCILIDENNCCRDRVVWSCYVNDYKVGLSRAGQIKLLVAIDLSWKDVSSNS
jgi:hypothetical protein